jgi:hypothetical protein
MRLEKFLKRMLHLIAVTEVFTFVKKLLIVSVIMTLIQITKLQKLLHLVI